VPSLAERPSGLLAQIADRLHDLCQPLTALQCRLEIVQMERRPDGAVFTGYLQCLEECRRMNLLMASMRELVQRARSMEDERPG
jgi:signal transduction histidine kinase